MDMNKSDWAELEWIQTERLRFGELKGVMDLNKEDGEFLTKEGFKLRGFEAYTIWKKMILKKLVQGTMYLGSKEKGLTKISDEEVDIKQGELGYNEGMEIVKETIEDSSKRNNYETDICTASYINNNFKLETYKTENGWGFIVLRSNFLYGGEGMEYIIKYVEIKDGFYFPIYMASKKLTGVSSVREIKKEIKEMSILGLKKSEEPDILLKMKTIKEMVKKVGIEGLDLEHLESL